MTNAISSTSSAASSSSASRTKLNASFDTFLKMLTSQLQYQDPLSPMDTAQFTNQLVMYSQVEQQLSTNDKLDSLISNQKQGGVQQLLGYMGYFVEAKTSNLALQSKNSYFNVTLADDASKLNIGIYDKDNKLVKSIQATGKKGTESFSWDGKDTNGVQLADGSYRITAVASRRDGTSVTSKVSTFGLVTGVDIDAQGKSVLKVNDVTINPDTVVSVRAPARNA